MHYYLPISGGIGLVAGAGVGVGLGALLFSYPGGKKLYHLCFMDNLINQIKTFFKVLLRIYSCSKRVTKNLYHFKAFSRKCFTQFNVKYFFVY